MRVLTKYILGDLLRMLLLTTAVLVTVISFGAAIKPLVNDRLLTIGQIAKYVSLATIPMLQFALPFSAGFASTLLFNRLTADNEVQAMATAGISYRRILRPIVVLGLVLLLAMVGLTQWVIPKAWAVMQRSITADITTIFQMAISRGEAFRIGNLQIYAEDIVVQEHPSDSQADVRMRLFKVAAAELDEQGLITTDVTASQATVDIYRRDGRTLLTIALADTVAYNGEAGQLIWTQEIRPDQPIVIPDMAQDDLETKNQRQLLALRADPDQLREVVNARQSLADTVRDASLFSFIDELLVQDGSIRLDQPGPEARSYLVRADRARRQKFVVGPGEVVEVVEYRGDAPERVFRTADVAFRRAGSQVLNNPVFDLVMTDIEVSEVAASSSSNQRARLTIPGLIVPAVASRDLSDLTSSQLLEVARDTARGREAIDNAIGLLENKIRFLRLDIARRLNKRYALCITAPLLLILGATLAMLFRGGLPLTIYLWAFLPSVLDLILIAGGDQMLRGEQPAGWFVLWSGNAVLLIILLVVFRRLARN